MLDRIKGTARRGNAGRGESLEYSFFLKGFDPSPQGEGGP